jgi:type I restriction enzyme S subunit
MNTKQLRQKILDLAIRGKLVPQDPNDEPASILLERIRAEKERLIKEGKIKRDKKNSAIAVGADKSHYEQFDIPDSWAWVNISQITTVISDGDHQPPPQSDSGVPFLVISDVRSGVIVFDKARYVSRNYYEGLPWTRKPYNGDVLFTVTGSYGIPIDVKTEKPFCFQRHIALLRPCIIESAFLSLFLKAGIIQQQCDQLATGIAQKTVGLESLRKIVIPLPPLMEQRRIVAAIEAAFAVIDEIERNNSDLQAAVAAAKSKILSLAISGKLVPQDPADEPASVLLERIRAEKEALIKAGKIKRDKSDSAIVRGDDNSYYENLPAGWIATSIDRLFISVGGGTPSTDKAEYWGDGVPWFSSADIDENGVIFPRRNVTQLGVDNSTTNVVPKGSIVVVTRVGIGKVAVLTSDMCFSQDNQALISRYPEAIYNRYLYHFLFNAMQSLKYSGRGTTISGITKKQLTDISVWLPPVAEQHRIVITIETAFMELDKIAENLN